MSTVGVPGMAPLPPAALSQDPEFVNAMRKLQDRKRWNAGLVLIVSLALFILVWQQQSTSAQGLVVILGVLLLHESGHYLGMRLFGYRDVRMFFIPFFGAAVSGKRGDVAAWKEGIVLLLGPLPGIALAFALGANGAIDTPVARQVAISLVTINAFNLLPLAGLDGARLWQHVLFSRRRWLEIAFQFCAAGAMAAVAIKSEVWILLAVAYLMLALLRLRWRVLGATNRIRAYGVAVPVDARDLDGDAARLVFREAHGALEWNRGSKQVAAVMEMVVEAVNARPPSAGASVALAGAWLFSVVLAFKTLALVLPYHRPLASWQLAPTHPQPLNLQLRPPRMLDPQSGTPPSPADLPARY